MRCERGLDDEGTDRPAVDAAHVARQREQTAELVEQ
jgi:hypothetical protein